MSIKSLYQAHVKNVAEQTQANHERQLARREQRNKSLMTAVAAVAAIAVAGKMVAK
jgi:hypothetical protein